MGRLVSLFSARRRLSVTFGGLIVSNAARKKTRKTRENVFGGGWRAESDRFEQRAEGSGGEGGEREKPAIRR